MPFCSVQPKEIRSNLVSPRAEQKQFAVSLRDRTIPIERILTVNVGPSPEAASGRQNMRSMQALARNLCWQASELFPVLVTSRNAVLRRVLRGCC
jgi:hypothetical protein